MKKLNIPKINAKDLLKEGLIRRVEAKKIFILSLIMLVLVSSVLAQSVFAQTVKVISENKLHACLHLIVILSSIIAIIFAIKASKLFAKGMGVGVWTISVGLAIMALVHFLEMMRHLGFAQSIELAYLTHDAISSISFILIAIGFYKVYKTVELVITKRAVKKSR